MMYKILILLVFLFFVSCANRDSGTKMSYNEVTTSDADNEVVENDIETCEGIETISSIYLIFGGTASSHTQIIEGSCKAEAVISCQIGMIDSNTCIGSCELTDVFWGDNGSGENAYSKIEVFTTTYSDTETHTGLWTPENTSERIQSYSGICLLAHSRFDVNFKFKFK